MRNFYLGSRFFYIFSAIIACIVLGFEFYAFFVLGKILLVVFICFIGLDTYWLYSKKNIVTAQRKLPKVFSLSDENKIYLAVQSFSDRKLSIEVVDEVPFQFQVRDLRLALDLGANEARELHYELRPTEPVSYTHLTLPTKA